MVPDRRVSEVSQPNAFITAKIAHAENNKTNNQYQRCINNADACVADGLYERWFYLVIILWQFLFVVNEKADGYIDNNAKRHTKNQDC